MSCTRSPEMGIAPGPRKARNGCVRGKIAGTRGLSPCPPDVLIERWRRASSRTAGQRAGRDRPRLPLLGIGQKIGCSFVDHRRPVSQLEQASETGHPDAGECDHETARRLPRLLSSDNTSETSTTRCSRAFPARVEKLTDDNSPLNRRPWHAAPRLRGERASATRPVVRHGRRGPDRTRVLRRGGGSRLKRTHAR